MNASRERETQVRGLVTAARASAKKGGLAVCLSELEQQNLFITNGLAFKTGHRERECVCVCVCVCRHRAA